MLKPSAWAPLVGLAVLSLTGGLAPPPNAAGPPRAEPGYGRLPLSFEENRGQTGAAVRFLSRGQTHTLFLTPAEMVLRLQRPSRSFRREPGCGWSAASSGPRSAVVRLRVAGGNPAAEMRGAEPLPGKANYLLGGDPGRWRTGIPTYGRVRCESVYPGIDLVYYGNDGQLEYDFIVAPGADPRRIRLACDGAERVVLEANGDLCFRTAAGVVRQQRPVVYQEVEGERRLVNGSYALKEEVGRMKDEAFRSRRVHPSSLILHPSEVAFNIGHYDHSRPLIIDPVLSYSTFLGGSGVDRGLGIAVDGQGAAYVTGYTASVNFPTVNAVMGDVDGAGEDVFVTKLSPNGQTLLYSTYLGGLGTSPEQEEGTAIAVDGSGNAYVTGWTSSIDDLTTPANEGFPLTPGAFWTKNDGRSVFVTKLGPTGSTLAYSTLINADHAPSQDFAWGIALDAGSAWITGQTDARDNPGSPEYEGWPLAGAFQTAYAGGSYDAFIVKVNPTGSALSFSTYLGGPDGGSDAEAGYGIAVDSAHAAYVTGFTSSTSFPTTSGGYQTARSAGLDGWVAKVGPSFTLDYCTLLGGVGTSDTCWAVAVDAGGNAYVTGGADRGFPATPGAYQRDVVGFYQKAFVTKLNPAGSGLVYSTYVAEESASTGYGIRVDGAGCATVVGASQGTGFPQVSPLASNDGNGAFVSRLNAQGTALLYSTVLPAQAGNETTARGVALDTARAAYVVGTTDSPNFPVRSAVQPARAGLRDAFISKISGGLNPPTAPTGLAVTALSSTHLALNWTDASSTESGFFIERRDASEARDHFRPRASVGANVRAFTDTYEGGVRVGRTYSYRVRAANADASSNYTGVASVLTLAPPANLAGQPLSGRRIRLAWTDSNASEQGFRIERKTGALAYSQVGSVTGATTFTDATVQSNTRYTYRVRAFGANAFSDYSSEVSVESLPAPPAPTNLAAQGLSGTRVQLTWSDLTNLEQGFKIERKTGTGAYGQVGLAGANVTQYVDTSASPETGYTYRIRAYNAEGNSPYSGEARVATLSSPSSLAAAARGNQVTLVWGSTSTHEAGYRVERKDGGPSAPGAYSEIAQVDADVLTYTHTVNLERAYTYRVRAFNANAVSGYSPSATATTLAPPGNLTAVTKSATSVQVSWSDASALEGGFRVEKKPGLAGDPGTYTLAGTAAANARTLLISSLPADATLTFRVQAVKGTNQSGYSNEVSATTLRPPLSLTAAADGSAVTLRWQDNSTAETGYRVERRTGTGSYSPIASLGTDTQSFVASEAVETLCTYRVYCVRGTYGVSPFSNEARVRPLAAPTNLAATALSPTQVRLTWVDPSGFESGFKIERRSGTETFTQVGTVGANIRAFTAGDLAAGRQYFFRVRAFGPGTNSAYSNETSATTPTALRRGRQGDTSRRQDEP